MIGPCLRSLLQQSRPPDRVVVVLDNCTDGTEAVVRQFPVECMRTVGNRAKKAGALNQALPLLGDSDFVLEVDADATADPHLLERGLQVMEADASIGGLSAREGLRAYGRLRVDERVIRAVVHYQRHLWDSMRMESVQNTMVLVGPGALLRTAAVLDVGGWDEDSLTEDNALSLDLRLHGWRTVLGPDCYVWSDSPLRAGEFWKQRVRWGRGFEDYFRRPWTGATWRGKMLYAYQWVLTAWMIVAVCVTVTRPQSFSPIWLVPLAVTYLDRLQRLRFFPERRWTDAALATPLGEWALFVFMQAANLAAVWQCALGRERKW